MVISINNNITQAVGIIIPFFLILAIAECDLVDVEEWLIWRVGGSSMFSLKLAQIFYCGSNWHSSSCVTGPSLLACSSPTRDPSVLYNRLSDP